VRVTLRGPRPSRATGGRFSDPLRPTVRTRAPTSVLGRSVWKKARDARQDAASPWPRGGRQRKITENLSILKKEAAPIGDGANCDGRNNDAFRGFARAAAGRPALPEHRAGEEGRLGRPPYAYTDELGEEDANTEIELRDRGRFYHM